MFRTLMVPLDGSELAERALPYAVRLAVASGARIALVRVALGPPPTGYDWERQQLDALSDAESYLREVADKVATRVPVRTLTPYGEASTQLLAVISELQVDGIVMATHGRTGLAHLLHGSVAEALLARSPVPVFLVHAQPGEATAPPFDPVSARIIVPLDGSTFAEAALPIALQMLGAAGELVLVSVAAPPKHVELDETGHVRAYLDQQEDSLRREALEYLRGVIAQLTRSDPDLHVAADVRIGEPAQGIVIAAIDRGADLVVMSTHGRTGLGRVLMGSVAGEVMRTGHTPVVLVGPTAVRIVSPSMRPAAAAV